MHFGCKIQEWELVILLIEYNIILTEEVFMSIENVLLTTVDLKVRLDGYVIILITTILLDMFINKCPKNGHQKNA